MNDLVAQVPRAVREVCGVLHGAGHEAFVVGGGVRDLLLERPHAPDWDVATSARPQAVLDLFDRAIPTGLRHGTVTVLREGVAVEVTTYRVESTYSDGRHPDSVVFVDRLEEDLARRDFTINAMALDPRDGSLHDPFAGQADLAARRIRAVGDPAARFAEDGLRPLRAVRFLAALEFTLDPETERAIPGALPTYRRVARERIRAELEKMLAAARPSLGLAPMDRTGLLADTLPELARAAPGVRDRAWRRADAAPSSWVARFAALHAELGSDVARAALERLRPSARDLVRAESLVAALPVLRAAEASGTSVRRALARVGRDLADEALGLWRADLAAGDEPPQVLARAAAVDALAREALRAGVPLSVEDLALSGDDVRAVLGIPPGPEVGRVLRDLLEVVLTDPELNDRAVLRARLRALAR
jgi:tRNA nucleotidyltransferase (CCA-adding enzyme)